MRLVNANEYYNDIQKATEEEKHLNHEVECALGIEQRNSDISPDGECSRVFPKH